MAERMWAIFTNNGMYSDIETVCCIVVAAILTPFVMAAIMRSGK